MNNTTEYQATAFEALGKVIFDLKNELYFKRVEVDRLSEKIANLESEIAEMKGAEK